MKKLFISLFIALTTITSTFADQEQNKNNSITINDKITLNTKTLEDENKDEHYKIVANYPQFEGQPLSPAAVRFNELTDKFVKAEIEKFKRVMKINAPNLQFIPEASRKNELYIDYKSELIKANKQTLISINMLTEGMTAGAAHPYHNVQTLNYNFTTGKIINLKDLFKPDSNYLNVFSKYATNKLEPDMHDVNMLKNGTQPQEKNYKNWNLQADGILITFNEYQVQAYTYGRPTVKIPYSQLKSIIAPHSVISVCVKNPENCEAINS